MKLLLDSHVLPWSIDRLDLLSQRVSEAILDEENDLYVSATSMWEIAIKAGAGKLHLSGAPDFLETHLRKELPRVHKDPFDRMLVAQAITERLTLVSKDEQFHRYPVNLLW